MMMFTVITGIIATSTLVIILGDVLWFWKQIAEDDGED